VALTRACVESIQSASAADGVQVEILVVDTSSTMERMQLHTICTQLGVEFVAGPPSVSEKRNLGAEQAKAENVMFVDSDCVVSPGCIAAHLATLQDPAVHASQGTILFRGLEPPVFRAIRSSGILNAFKPALGLPVRAAASGNLMVRRAPFLVVRFDPRLGPPGLGGEDVDFGLRLSDEGFRIIGTPAAIVYHDTVTWNALRSNVRRFFSWGRSEAYLIERHPTIAYLDMPSPVLAALLLGSASAASVWWSWLALLALPLGFLSYAAFMSVAGARHNSEDRLGGALGHWVFFVLDLGRVWESFRRARPHASIMRLRFTEDQVTQEWPDLVPTAWGVWFMVLQGIIFIWWAVPTP
jgi:glycosyltransferase involved in cell wall biosynthesis